MTKSQFKKILDRYLKGQANQKDSDLIDEFYERSTSHPIVPPRWNEMEKRQLEARIYRKIKNKTTKSSRSPVLYFLTATAAIGILLIGYFFLRGPTGTIPVSEVFIQEISITAEETQRSVLLSDGSYVLLNPGATLTFPEQFEGDFRKVVLDGEAWFDVHENAAQPFQVISHEITTTVLGTTFTISAHPDNSKIEVKVTSGKVKVSAKDQEIAILEMDDHLEYEAGSFRVTQHSEDSETIKEAPQPDHWKLADVTLAEAVEFLEKRWDKVFTFEGEHIRKCLLYASFNAEDPLDEVMMIICGVTNTNYTMEQDSIKIYGPGCQPEE